MKPLETAAAAAVSAIPPANAAAPVRHPNAPEPGTEIGAHYSYCFICGSQHPGGLHLQMVAAEGVAVTARFEATAAHQGGPGLLHGGLLAGAFDEVFGAVNWLLRAPAVTGRMETDYLKPIPIGSMVHITARCVALAGRKVYLQAEAWIGGPAGELAAQAAALFVQIKLDQFLTRNQPEGISTRLTDPDQYRLLSAFEV